MDEAGALQRYNELRTIAFMESQFGEVDDEPVDDENDS